VIRMLRVRRSVIEANVSHVRLDHHSGLTNLIEKWEVRHVCESFEGVKNMLMGLYPLGDVLEMYNISIVS
jgi:hypothetical protein